MEKQPSYVELAYGTDGKHVGYDSREAVVKLGFRNNVLIYIERNGGRHNSLRDLNDLPELVLGKIRNDLEKRGYNSIVLMLELPSEQPERNDREAAVETDKQPAHMPHDYCHHRPIN